MNEYRLLFAMLAAAALLGSILGPTYERQAVGYTIFSIWMTLWFVHKIIVK